jgi:glycosyltransferase involved in cell wall biosynthesis
MRIALAVHHFPPKYSAGAELRAYRTARWLINNGHEVQIITVESVDNGPYQGVYWEDDEYKGLQVRRLSFDISKSQDQFTWEYENPWIYNHLVEYLAEIKPDVFHLISGYVFGAGALKAASWHRIPIVVTLTDFWFYCPRINLVRSNGILSNAYEFDAQNCTRCKFEEKRRYLIPAKLMPNFADRLWASSFNSRWSSMLGIDEMEKKFKDRNRTLMEELAKASAIICPAHFLIDTLHSRGIPDQKLHLIQHGLDKSSWTPVVDGNSNDIFRIGYLGQINHHKGVHLLIRAFKELQTNTPLELRIYGDATGAVQYTKSLEKISKKDARIKFFGRYDYDQVANIFSQLDVLVIPSIWNEIGPWVMYEALGTKTPVIASNIPNMSHIILDGENGLLFECGNWQDLAFQLKKLIENNKLRSDLVQGINPVNTIEHEMADLNQVYESVVNQIPARMRVQQA